MPEVVRKPPFAGALMIEQMHTYTCLTGAFPKQKQAECHQKGVTSQKIEMAFALNTLRENWLLS